MASSLEKAKTDMGSFTGLIDLVTLGSRRPMRRLLAYYVIMGLVVAALLYFFPIVGQAFSGGRLTQMTDGAQERVGGVLDEVAGRWRLDEIKTNDGRPSRCITWC